MTPADVAALAAKGDLAATLANAPLDPIVAELERAYLLAVELDCARDELARARARR